MNNKETLETIGSILVLLIGVAAFWLAWVIL
jgi:hypothetical protein